jgi:hypothetical protein
MCTESPDAPNCPGEQRCLQANDGALALCLDNCDILSDPWCEGLPGNRRCLPDQASCDLASCFPFGEAGGFFCLVVPTEGFYWPVGEPCDFEDECEFGLACAPAAKVAGCAGATGCCTPYCNLAAPDCAAGTCQPVFEPGTAPANIEHVGACLLP